MVGRTLVEIRERLEALASPDGRYGLVCARTGERPVPAEGLRFRDRATARRAATATQQYRATLRKYDRRLPHHDVIVVEGDPARPPHGMGARGDRFRFSQRVVGTSDPTPRPADRIEYCHRVAAAVFEALSAAGFDAVESAVMDTYLEHAETVEDLDELCLCLLECMAAELDDRLDPTDLAAVVDSAASRLPASRPTTGSLAASLGRLQRAGVVGAYDVEAASGEDRDDRRSLSVRLTDYALSPRRGRLPVLPLVLAVARQDDDWTVSAVDVERAAGGWRLRVDLALAGPPVATASAPIGSNPPF